ncbi:outer membrane efflux protein [Magnetococcus marinus MC-1]|uniref:Outer membrane efflux protein n=2 Tax=Magnetococcus TaxID=162171 RepID=A0LA69_MAGMM|nr:outer membrane efflux protein [Magnetococcus marinus MC-1]
MGRIFMIGLLLCWPLGVAAETIKLDLAALIQEARQHSDPRVALVQAKARGAEAALAAVEAAKRARLNLELQGKRFESHDESSRRTDYQTVLEVKQPIPLFGRQQANEQAASQQQQRAQWEIVQAQADFVVEVIERYYQLHASELAVQNLDEAHALAYVRWDRAKELLALGKTDELEVAQWLAQVERTRHKLYQARSENRMVRGRLALLTGHAVLENLIQPPKAPAKFPTEFEEQALFQFVMLNNPRARAANLAVAAARAKQQAVGFTPDFNLFARVGQSARPLSGRDRWAVGLTLSLPLWSGGALDAQQQQEAASVDTALAQQEALQQTLQLALKQRLNEIADAKQGLIAAGASLRWAQANLLKRQSLYQMERVATLGDAMVEQTQAEADQVRAYGAYYGAAAQLAALMGDAPEAALQADYLVQLAARSGQEHDSSKAGFTPPSGSGYGDNHVAQ